LIRNGIPLGAIEDAKRPDDNNFQTIFFEVEHINLANNSALDEGKTVKESIQDFNYLAKPINIEVLTGVDTATLQNKIEEIAAGKKNNGYHEIDYGPNNLPLEDGSESKSRLTNFKFSNLSLKKDSVQIFFKEMIGAGQALPKEVVISLPSRHEQFTAPSPLVFAGFDSNLINRMHRDKSQLDNIQGLYGNQSIFDTQNLLRGAIEKNSGPLSILGFDISRKWFPFAMLIMLLLINILLKNNLGNAKNSNLKIISTNVSDDPMEFLVTNKIIRLALWVFGTLIITSSILYTSFISYSPAYYVIMMLVSVSTCLYGYKAFRISQYL
jgi:hypothetical protein